MGTQRTEEKGSSMSQDMDKLFEGMANADIYGKGSWMSEGNYVVTLKNIEVTQGRNPRKASTYKKALLIVEFEIAETNRADKHPVGAKRSTVLNSGSDYFFADVSKLMMSLLGYDPSKKENQSNPEVRGAAESFAAAQCGSAKARAELGDLFTEGMFVGKRLGLECTSDAPTPENPNPFTNMFWSPVTSA